MNLLIGVLIAVVILIIILAKLIRVVPQGSVYVVERLGQFDCVWSPGLHFKKPFIQSIRKVVPKYEIPYDVPESRAITKDNVTLGADAFIFYQVFDSKQFTYGTYDVRTNLQDIAQSALRNLIGSMEFEDCLTNREKISKEMTRQLDSATDKWGVKVTRVEIKTFNPPRDIQESMERQMKADRERREQLIRAEADKKASILAAEKDKAVALLNAEAAKESAELSAEAKRITYITNAEAQRDAALIRAETQKRVQIIYAQANAEAERIIQKAKAEAMQALNAANPSNAVLKIQAMSAFQTAAESTSTKWVIPTNIQDIFC